MAEKVPHIGPYAIDRALARGAMGTVFLGTHPKLNIPVAIKILLPEFLQNEKVRQRFEREARAIAALRHPGIVDIFDFGHDSEHGFYLCMEYIDGPHLGDIEKQVPKIPESVLVSIGAELCTALDVAHAKGILHRDLKPENVFMDKGRLVLGDFGIVKAITEDHPLDDAAADPQTEVIGTPGFIAPEQLRHQPLEQRTDVFALGSLLYFLASGNFAFTAKSPYLLEQKFHNERPTSLFEQRPDLSHDFVTILERCLAVDMEMRPLSMSSLRAEFREILNIMGVRDTRDELAKFQKSPSGYHYHARMRSVNYLTEQLKISVRDNDRKAVEQYLKRLESVDPVQHQGYEISGVREILQHEKPSLASDTSSPAKSQTTLLLSVLIFTFCGAGLWFYSQTQTHTERQTTMDIRHSIKTIEFSASHPTTIFLNGRLYGENQSTTQMHIDGQFAELEFVHQSYGKIVKQVEFKGRQQLSLHLDWATKSLNHQNSD